MCSVSLTTFARLPCDVNDQYPILLVGMQPHSIYSALRPWTFTASLSPTILGAILSYKSYGQVHFFLLFVTVAAVLAVNGAGNMVNTYFDFMRAVGTRTHEPERKNGSVQVAVERPQHLDQTQVVNFAAYLYGFGMACLWLLMWLSPARSEHLAALFFGGLSGSFLYTGGIGLKYYILGDLLVMFTFGPLSLLFSFVVQCGEFQVGPLLFAIPLALSTEAIIHIKHVRELEADKHAGILSLAVLLGKQGSYFLFAILLFVPYLVFVIWGTQYSLSLGLPLLTMPYAFQLERTLREQGPTRSVSIRAAKLNLILSLFFIVGCLLARNIPFISVQL